MEKDYGKIKKNDDTTIIVRVDDFGGKAGLTIREFVSSDKYTGFTKSGTRIPAESFEEFKKMINGINPADFTVSPEAIARAAENKANYQAKRAGGAGKSAGKPAAADKPASQQEIPDEDLM